MDNNVVVIAYILLQTEEERFADALETDDVTHDISRDAVHAVNLQESEVLVVTSTVYPPIEKSHQNEAIATADEHHRTCPDVFTA